MLNKEPKNLWKYFEELSAIPRPSKHEEAAANWAVGVAKEHGLDCKRDAVGNVVISVPATKGHERTPVTVLQGHLDMVCEKNSGTKHDFMKDPINLVLKGDTITADGTTLGADNGIGIAMALALIDEKRAIHGPLELLFTVDEETGLNGATGLKPGFLKGKRLLNLDSEEEGEIYVGCAGGIDTTLTLRVGRGKRTRGQGAYTLHIGGLRGGHSGCDIHEGRGNANRCLARCLKAFEDASLPYGLAEINGGSKRNAIPREASALLYFDEKTANRARRTAKKLQATFREELKRVDAGVTVKLSKAAKTGFPPLTDASRVKVVNFMMAIPHGLISYSREIHGLVETSTNFATIETTKGTFIFGTSQRSSVESQLDWAAQWIGAIGLTGGAKVVRSDGYPGWEPNLDSKLLKSTLKTYKRIFNKEPQPKAIHAGLECGIIGSKYPGMDMVSLGPDITNVHSPDEAVSVSSVKRTYDFLLALLKDLA